MSVNWRAVMCFGLAWPFAGLGFSAINLGYVPEGLALVAEVVGLFLATGYAMFAPLALLGGLLAPSPFESGSESPVGLAIMAFLAIVIYASAVIGIGLAFTGGLAVAAHSLAVRIHSSTMARPSA
jgi:hypothetical protein